MLSLKKVYRDELLQLALILSLLRGNSNPYFENDIYNSANFDLDNGTSWRSLSPGVLRQHFVHPKSLDSVLLNYERELFADLNSLGRYNRASIYTGHPDVTAYLLNIERNAATTASSTLANQDVSSEIINPPQDQNQDASLAAVENEASSGPPDISAGLELTQEDMDLIEVLWKQDVDLGFSLDLANAAANSKNEKPESNSNEVQNGTITPTTSISVENDDIEKLKTLKALNDDNIKEEPENDLADPWAGLNYTIDTETGEYVIKAEELSESLTGADCGPSCDLPLGDLSLPLPEFLLDEALRLVELDDDTPQDAVNVKDLENIAVASSTGGENNREQDTSAAAAAAAAAAVALAEVGVQEEESAPGETSEGETSTAAAAAPAAAAGATEESAASGGGAAAAATALGVTTAPGENSSDSTAAAVAAEEELQDILADMIQTTQFHHPHHRAFQSRMPFVRTMSMEQRWQDLANLLSLPSPGDASGMPHPFSHHPHHHHHPALHNYSHPHAPHGMGYGPEATRGVLLHNATLNPPMGDLNSTVPYSNIGGTNLGNAVATSMNLTNSSEPMGEANSAPHYKIEPTHDMMYYQNTTSELNQTDGFLSSILNDEDLQLMDMAMNEGMYTMRMLDSNNAISNLSMNGGPSGAAAAMSRTDVERMDTSSDSAVSSMGSERVPSLSDGEWCDAGSDSGHTPGDHYVTDYQTKYRPYDYSYTSRQHTSALGASDTARLPQVAQKKHQMFGKRYLQEQGSASAVVHQPPPVKYEYRDPSTTPYNSTSQPEGAVGPKPPEMKYSCSIEFGRHNHLVRNSIDHIQHNHTYHLPAESTGAMQRPVSRDKSKSRKSEEEHLTRDEKRARALNVPITVDDIINLPMDEFNERLSKYDLSEAQLSLIRDIRRRGKNKVAAQNCRKRKLDQILSLADEVKDMRDRKMRLMNEHEFVTGECQRMKDKYQQLYRHVFQNLRDPDGNQYSPYQYSLQTSADGSILVVPRSNSTMMNQERKDPPPPPNHKE